MYSQEQDYFLWIFVEFLKQIWEIQKHTLLFTYDGKYQNEHDIKDSTHDDTEFKGRKFFCGSIVLNKQSYCYWIGS